MVRKILTDKAIAVGVILILSISNLLIISNTVKSDPPFSFYKQINTDYTSTDQGYPSMDADSSGNLYIAWEDRRNDNYDIYFANSSDGGETWLHPNKKVNTDVGTEDQHNPSLVVDSDGNIYVVWEDKRNMI